jgi:hypothetical protein
MFEPVFELHVCPRDVPRSSRKRWRGQNKPTPAENYGVPSGEPRSTGNPVLDSTALRASDKATSNTCSTNGQATRRDGPVPRGPAFELRHMPY